MEWFKRILSLLLDFINEKMGGPIPPKPDPLPEPEPPKPKPGEDQIDPRTVAWDEPKSPASWSITARILDATISRDGMWARHEGTERWPVRADGGEKPSIGNWWLIAKIDGRWHGATVEWLGVGKMRVVGKRWDGTDDIHGPLGRWRYTPGETVGIMLSTVARGAPYTIEERSQIFTVKVP